MYLIYFHKSIDDVSQQFCVSLCSYTSVLHADLKYCTAQEHLAYLLYNDGYWFKYDGHGVYTRKFSFHR